MTLRELGPDELGALLALYRHLHTDDDPLPEAAKVGAVWQAILDNPDIRYFGVFIDGTLVSCCTLSVIPNLTRGCRPYGLIENVVTDPEFRRCGHGRRVLQAALELAWSRGCYKVMLMTGRLDPGTFRFYENAGFSRHAKQAFVARPEPAALARSETDG